jgi:sugar phosphate isomerase/epimerase
MFEPLGGLGLALAGLDSPGAEPVALRERVAIAGRAGFRSVRLDATAPNARPRDFDRSARRDLASTLRRAGVRFGGVDLFIPAGHLLDPARADRAVAAVVSALEFVAELARLDEGGAGFARAVTMDLGFPDGAEARLVRSELERAAERCGAVIADVALGLGDAAGVALGGASSPFFGAEIDPGMALVRGVEPVARVHALARAGALAGARLSDASSLGRCVPGAGRLDMLAYSVALVTAGVRGPIVIDLRGVDRAAARTLGV